METIKQHDPEKKHKSGIAIKPKQFAIGGQVFEREELIGFAADTVRKRLAKKGVEVTAKWAKSFVERYNKKGA